MNLHTSMGKLVGKVLGDRLFAALPVVLVDEDMRIRFANASVRADFPFSSRERRSAFGCASATAS